MNVTTALPLVRVQQHCILRKEFNYPPKPTIIRNVFVATKLLTPLLSRVQHLRTVVKQLFFPEIVTAIFLSAFENISCSFYVCNRCLCFFFSLELSQHTYTALPVEHNKYVTRFRRWTGNQIPHGIMAKQLITICLFCISVQK